MNRAIKILEELNSVGVGVGAKPTNEGLSSQQWKTKHGTRGASYLGVSEYQGEVQLTFQSLDTGFDLKDAKSILRDFQEKLYGVEDRKEAKRLTLEYENRLQELQVAMAKKLQMAEQKLEDETLRILKELDKSWVTIIGDISKETGK